MGEKDPRGDAGQSWGFDGCILQFQKWQEMLGRRGVHQDCCPGGQLLGVGSQEQQGSRARFPGGSTLVVGAGAWSQPHGCLPAAPGSPSAALQPG